jgi:hypothetical protein
MRVLFVPYHLGTISHGLPLIALNNMLKGSSIEKSFLFPKKAHRAADRAGLKILDIDHTGFRTEMQAYGLFAPDVVVDDNSFFTGFATTLEGLPRITIQRTGVFPGHVPRNPNHKHSLDLDISKIPNVTALGLTQPKTLSDLFKADVKIIPGIKSIEVLPAALEADRSYVYSGPLIVNDYLTQGGSGADRSLLSADEYKDFESLRMFFDSNVGRKIVYVTFGTIARADEAIFACIRHMLDRGWAVVSSIKVEPLNCRQSQLYYYSNYLPMHYVCSNADLMVHQCGSGTYHYPIINNVPTITIGTMCYDRDDVALRLEALGASRHLRAPGESENFIGAFKSMVETYFENGGAFLQEMKRNIAKLNAEIEQTRSSFDFEAILGWVHGSAKVKKQAK